MKTVLKGFLVWDGEKYRGTWNTYSQAPQLFKTEDGARKAYNVQNNRSYRVVKARVMVED